MIYVVLRGGLGNQLFQYAAGRGLAHKLGAPLALVLSEYTRYRLRRFALGNFNIAAHIIADMPIDGWRPSPWLFWKRWKCWPAYIREPHFHFWPGLGELGAPVVIDGYWQSEKYFSSIADLIVSDFQLPPLTAEHQLTLSRIRKCRAVSLHVRRGDYVTNSQTNHIHGTLSAAWYRGAIDVIKSKVPGAKFFIFSDDIGWAKENLPHSQDMNFVSKTDDGGDEKDLYLMSQCQHQIIANSSFSWWGAWLNRNPQKIVITPARWFAHSPHDTSDLIPENWQKL